MVSCFESNLISTVPDVGAWFTRSLCRYIRELNWHEKETQQVSYVGKNPTFGWKMAAIPEFAQRIYYGVKMYLSLEITNDKIWRTLCR